MNQWQDAAACAGSDPESFFPARRSEKSIVTTEELAAVRACAGCPVRRQCAADALTKGDRHGIRAGLNLEVLGFDAPNALRKIAGLPTPPTIDARTRDGFVTQYRAARDTSWTHDEIAAEMGITPDSLHRRCQRHGVVIPSAEEISAEHRLAQFTETRRSFHSADISESRGLAWRVLRRAIKAGRIQVTCDCGAAAVIRASTFNASPTGSIDALSEHVAHVIDSHVRGEQVRAVDSLAAAYRGFADSAAGDDSYLAGSRTAWQDAAHFLSTDLKARGVL